MKKAISMLKQWWIGLPRNVPQEQNIEKEHYRHLNEDQERALARLTIAAKGTRVVAQEALQRLRHIR